MLARKKNSKVRRHRIQRDFSTLWNDDVQQDHLRKFQDSVPPVHPSGCKQSDETVLFNSENNAARKQFKFTTTKKATMESIRDRTKNPFTIGRQDIS